MGHKGPVLRHQARKGSDPNTIHIIIKLNNLKYTHLHAFMVVTLHSLVCENSHVTHQNQVLQEPSTAQQIKKFPENILLKFCTLYKIWKSITVFSRACHRSLLTHKWIQLTPFCLPGCWYVLSPIRKETSYRDQTLTFASHSKTIPKAVRPTRSPRQQWPPRQTKNSNLSIVLSVGSG